jgi:hypothetical protein
MSIVKRQRGKGKGKWVVKRLFPIATSTRKIVFYNIATPGNAFPVAMILIV